MQETQAPTATEPLKERPTKSFDAGVSPYREAYWDPSYEPRETDLLCAFGIQPKPGVDTIEAAAAVAAESATGTGRTLEQTARECPELREAIELWKNITFED